MRFTKMQGAGNDYVYVDCFAQPLPADPAALAKKISDRHFGVGGDGLILICPSAIADARMRIFNADGSEAEMCGNGVRCAAKYIYDRGLCRRERLRIETGRGVLELDLQIKAGKVSRVRVDMGEPILEAEKIPVSLSEMPSPPAPLPKGEGSTKIVDYPVERFIPAGGPDGWLDACGWDRRMTCVSMGNPHAVLFCRDAAAVPLEWIGPLWERLSIFPQRINVHFAAVLSPGDAAMRTWERGSGITLACGTGACAVCVAAALTGRAGRNLHVRLPGGELHIDWAADNHVYMTGAAVEVFSGEWEES
jgi:diaminopimelate epimerase